MAYYPQKKNMSAPIGVETRRAFMFLFTDGDVGKIKACPIPFPVIADIWRARVEDVAGSAIFEVYFATSETAALTSVGGTNPSVTTARGSKDDNGLDWTTVSFTTGMILAVKLVSLSIADRATLSIEAVPL